MPKTLVVELTEENVNFISYHADHLLIEELCFTVCGIFLRFGTWHYGGVWNFFESSYGCLKYLSFTEGNTWSLEEP